MLCNNCDKINNCTVLCKAMEKYVNQDTVYQHDRTFSDMNIDEECMELAGMERPIDSIETILTPTELKVLALKLQGYTNKEISGELSISISTVRSHISNIKNKI